MKENILKKDFEEPLEAFPYLPPTNELKEKYSHIFDLKSPLKPRFFKSLFDKTLSLIFLVITSPILLLLKISYLIEGVFFPENKGPLFFYYYAMSGGK